jgi:hypothetical protein
MDKTQDSSSHKCTRKPSDAVLATTAKAMLTCGILLSEEKAT